MPGASPVTFFKEGVSFRLQHREGLKRWLLRTLKDNKVPVQQISVVFCSDRYLLKLNRQYLRHNYLTDIITFDNSLPGGKMNGDIFISVERVAANAKKFNTTFRDELHRVMIHGVLHLSGYNDKSPGDRKAMREAEEYRLGQRHFLKNSPRR